MEMKMTVIDMMNEIAGKMKALNEADDPAKRKIAIEDAAMTVELSKEFYVGADLVIRADSLLAKTKELHETRVNKVIGE